MAAQCLQARALHAGPAPWARIPARVGDRWRGWCNENNSEIRCPSQSAAIPVPACPSTSFKISTSGGVVALLDGDRPLVPGNAQTDGQGPEPSPMNSRMYPTSIAAAISVARFLRPGLCPPCWSHAAVPWAESGMGSGVHGGTKGGQRRLPGAHMLFDKSNIA